MAKSLRHIRTTEQAYHIRFRDRSRSPQEVTFTFDRSAFSSRQIERRRDELRYLWQSQEWDPWTGRLPGESTVEYRTLSDAVVSYCEHKRLLGERGVRGGWNNKTYTDCSSELGLFARRCNPKRLTSELSERDVENWIFDHSVRPASRAKRRRVLKTFLQWMVGEGLLPAMLDMGPQFIERQTMPDYYSEEDLYAICEAHVRNCNDLARRKHVPKVGRHSPLFKKWKVSAYKFAFYQGLRLGELMAMRVHLINLSRKFMYVGDADFIPKGRDERIITITPPAREAIAPFLEDKQGKDRVWPSCQPKRMSEDWKAALLRAIDDGAVPEHKAHMSLKHLRQSCCEYWLNERQIPVERVQELLRHKDIKTTMKHYKSTNVHTQTAVFEV